MFIESKENLVTIYYNEESKAGARSALTSKLKGAWLSTRISRRRRKEDLIKVFPVVNWIIYLTISTLALNKVIVVVAYTKLVKLRILSEVCCACFLFLFSIRRLHDFLVLFVE